MPKFSIGEFVQVKSGAQASVGRIASRTGAKYTVFTSHRAQVSAHSKELKRLNRAVLILESNLSSGRAALRTDQQRRAGLFLEELFRSLGFTVLREKVHTRDDLKHFMRVARHRDVHYVHWDGHGAAVDDDDGRNVTALILRDTLLLPPDSESEIDAAIESGRYRRKKCTRRQLKDFREFKKDYDDLRAAFSELKGKTLVFSACELGSGNGLARHVSELSDANAVIAYDGTVTDAEARTAEALLYFKLANYENKRRTVGKLVAEVRAAMPSAKGAELPMVCFVRGQRVA